MKKIAVITSTRAEYGLLKPLIIRLQNSEMFDVRVVVTGMHLSPEFGMTVNEIIEDGIRIDKKIEILLSSDSRASMSKSMGMAMISFSDYFEENTPDAIVVLGDRYEMMAICCAATNHNIPIIHIHGGELTYGAIDDAYRHSISKMSFLHFTSTEEYRRRVIQMGESPERVFNVGALGVENALNTELLSVPDLENKFGIMLKGPFAVGTFHPVTLEKDNARSQMDNLLKAIEKYDDLTFLFTYANSDYEGRIINDMLIKYSETHNNLIVIKSLGSVGYLSAVKNSLFVIGNSSSGILEVPSFGIPTVNIGDRQAGRIKANSVIDCDPTEDSIVMAIERARSKEFREIARKTVNPYGCGETSSTIVKIIAEKMKDKNFGLKNKFFDISFSTN